MLFRIGWKLLADSCTVQEPLVQFSSVGATETGTTTATGTICGAEQPEAAGVEQPEAFSPEQLFFAWILPTIRLMPAWILLPGSRPLQSALDSVTKKLKKQTQAQTKLNTLRIFASLHVRAQKKPDRCGQALNGILPRCSALVDLGIDDPSLEDIEAGNAG
jgi:hypothetical protein